MGWGDGHLEDVGLGLGEENSEWSFDNKVALNSSLVFLSGEWNLESDGSVSLP